MKSKWLKWSGLSILVVLAALLATQALAAAGDTTRVSVASDGTQGNRQSIFSSISADGRYVVFQSGSRNLVSGDTNSTTDVFVHDRQTGTTTRVSVSSSGAQGDGYSDGPAISADGRYVAFYARASNLVSEDTNGVDDIFLHDRQTGATKRVSVASDGTQANNSSYYSPSLSADGRYVAFCSYASNLVSGDTNGTWDIFVHDTQTNIITLISVDSSGVQGSSESSPSISADGRYVAFSSNAGNLVSGDTNNERDIFVHDMQAGTTTRASVGSGGTQGNYGSYFSSLSADGRFVAFESDATDLVSGDTNNERDIFVHDMQTGTTTRLSMDSSGTQGNGISEYASISADGRYVAFFSQASNLVNGDTNGSGDIFIHGRQMGTTTRVSVASDGTQGNLASYYPSISADGRYVTFGSVASNLVSGDTNGWDDIFVHETGVVVPTPTPTPATLPDTGFAPQHGTVLSAQPAEKAYAGLGDLWLEIPRLGVQMPIVGVPQVDGEWDVSWLGKQAGWLNSTAFPTHAGNTVLAGHVYDAYGKPGPFVRLNGLWWGDKIIVHAWGAQYVYEVRQVMQVAPGATSSVIKHEELPWVTLITCRGYDEASDSYKYRVVVRAVLVEVK